MKLLIISCFWVLSAIGDFRGEEILMITIMQYGDTCNYENNLTDSFFHLLANSQSEDIQLFFKDNTIMYSPRKTKEEAEEWYDLKIKLEKERSCG